MEESSVSVKVSILAKILIDYQKLQDDIMQDRIASLFENNEPNLRKFWAHYHSSCEKHRTRLYSKISSVKEVKKEEPAEEKEDEEEVEEEDEEAEEEEEEVLPCKCTPLSYTLSCCLPTYKGMKPRKWLYPKHFMKCPVRVQTLVELIDDDVKACELAENGNFKFVPAIIRDQVRSMWIEQHEDEEAAEFAREDAEEVPPKLSPKRAISA
jgi:hypothetical protein